MATKPIQKLVECALLPRTIIASIVLGAVLGATQPALSKNLATYADLYLGLLQMCVLPILVTAVISSIGSVFQAGQGGHYIPRMFAIFVIGLSITSFAGIMIAEFAEIGSSLGDSERSAISKLILAATPTTPTSSGFGILEFAEAMIPKNFFRAMTEDNFLRVLFFSILLGVALGRLPDGKAGQVLSTMDGLYAGLIQMMKWFMIPLPLGIVCIFASQVSNTGPEIFLVMLPLILATYFGSFLIILLSLFAIWRASGLKLTQVLSGIRSPMFMALATSSSYATMPVSLESLHKKLGFDRTKCDLFLPIGTSMQPLGNALSVSLKIIFVAHLYGLDLGLTSYPTLMLGALLTAVATAGAPGPAAVALLGIALGPLGLPVEPAMVMFLAMSPMTDPVVTTANVMGNCAAAAWFARGDDYETEIVVDELPDSSELPEARREGNA